MDQSKTKRKRERNRDVQVFAELHNLCPLRYSEAIPTNKLPGSDPGKRGERVAAAE